MLFEVKNLCYSYYKKPLCLKDVSFVLEKGQKVLVLASKDVGKTTLVKVCSGFETSYFGNIFLNGKQIKKIDDKEKNVSLLLSEPVLFQHKTIKQNIDYLFDVTGKDELSDEKLESLLKEFYIDKELNTKVKKLSLPQKRQLAMLRSSLKNPDIYFVDDQFENLNAEECENIKKLYNSWLTDKNKTMLCTIGDESFCKVKELICSNKFDDIIFLSGAKDYHYLSIEQFFCGLPTLEATRFLYETKTTKMELLKKNDEYFIFDGENFYLKLDKNFYEKFSALSLGQNDSENVVIANKIGIDIFQISDEKFNKCLFDGDIFVYLALDESRLI